MQNVIIRDIMCANVTTAKATSSLCEIFQSLYLSQHSCVILVEGKVPIGIVTENNGSHLLHDMLGSEQQQDLSLANYVSLPPLTIDEDASLFEALVLTRTRRIRHLPVTDCNGQLCGVLTQKEISEAYFKIIEDQSAVIESEIEDKTRELQEANTRLKEMSLQDPLLGIGNRRAMDVDLTYSHSLACRHSRELSLALIDVDHFKLYNDHYGHQQGDKALKAVSNCIANMCRQSDRLYRYGGEEFLLLMPETDNEGARILTERITYAVVALSVEHLKSDLQTLSISCGLSSLDVSEKISMDDLVENADRALYKAKANGRNQVI